MYRNDLIKGAMAAHDLTLERLATRAGLSPATVSAIRNGRENVTLHSLTAVAEAVGFVVEINFIPKREPATASAEAAVA
ncbi:MAG: helix-turn-helix transcriptional regulator [Pyrinomonadaceae bacterium]